MNCINLNIFFFVIDVINRILKISKSMNLKVKGQLIKNLSLFILICIFGLNFTCLVVVAFIAFSVL